MVQGQVFLKAGGQYLIFSKFIIILIPAKIVLYIFEDKLLFFCQHNFMKKHHSKLSKNECV